MKEPLVGRIYANYRFDKSECAIWRIITVEQAQEGRQGIPCKIQRMGGEWSDEGTETFDIVQGTWHADWELLPTHKACLDSWINSRR